MKLIVDGPDGSGKSHTIEQLGLTPIHLKSLRGGVGGTTLEGWAGADDAPVAYARKLIESPDGTAFDRFYLSEMVYGPMLRGQAAITEEEVTLVQRVERAMGISTVVCLPSYGTTLRNVMQAGRERPVYQTPTFLRGAYEAWCRVRGTHTFNYETGDLRQLQLLLHYDAGASALPALTIGSPRATTLVVTTDHLYLPAFSMKDLAAATLNRALWYAGWREESLAFTNALQASPSPSPGVKAALLPPIKTIIAVGHYTASLLREQGIENGAPNVPLVFTVADPRFTTLTNLTDTLKSIYESATA